MYRCVAAANLSEPAIRAALDSSAPCMISIYLSTRVVLARRDRLAALAP